MHRIPKFLFFFLELLWTVVLDKKLGPSEDDGTYLGKGLLSLSRHQRQFGSKSAGPHTLKVRTLAS